MPRILARNPRVQYPRTGPIIANQSQSPSPSWTQNRYVRLFVPLHPAARIGPDRKGSGQHASHHENDLEIENLPGHARTRTRGIRVGGWFTCLRVRSSIARHRHVRGYGVLEGAERVKPADRRRFQRVVFQLEPA
jgi:hypothetical protein